MDRDLSGNSFLTEDELHKIGFKKLGRDVRISAKASIYGAGAIEVGDHVRIDDFCIVSGHVRIGSHVHISAYTGLFAGDAGIGIGDFCTISSRCAVYAVSDDYSGAAMTNPTVPDEYRGVVAAPVVFGDYSIIGSGCTVLPGVRLGQGASVGAMSLIKEDLDEWGLYAGIPCRKIRERKRDLIAYAEKIKD